MSSPSMKGGAGTLGITRLQGGSIGVLVDDWSSTDTKKDHRPVKDDGHLVTPMHYMIALGVI